MMNRHPDLIMLHIGKTGGSALRGMLQAAGLTLPGSAVVMLQHDSTLADAAAAYPDAQIGFFIRDPLRRLISGFYSRRRKGQPRLNSAHSPQEAAAFAAFDTPRALANALAADDQAAQAALDAISHIRKNLCHFLGTPDSFAALSARIGFIGQVECYDHDIDRLKPMLGIPANCVTARDDLGAHRNPPDLDQGLDPAGEGALRRWLAPDYAVYGACLAHPAISATHPAPRAVPGPLHPAAAPHL